MRDRAGSLHGQRRQRVVALVAHAGRVDGSVGGHGNGGDLAARRLEEHVAFPLRTDAINQPASVRAGNQVGLRVPAPLRFPGQAANVLLVALEKELRLCSGLADIYAVNRSRPARGNVKPPGSVEGHLPDVVRSGFGFVCALLCAFVRSRLAVGSFAGCLAVAARWLVQFGGIEDYLGAGLILLGGCVRLQTVDLAAGHCGRIERAIRPNPHHLHAQVFRLEERERLAVLSHAQHSRRRGGSQVGCAAFVHGN